jgi:hypothetical protein
MNTYGYPTDIENISPDYNIHENEILREMVITGLQFLDKFNVEQDKAFKGDEFIHPKREELEHEIAKIGMYDKEIPLPSPKLLGMRRMALQHTTFVYRYGWTEYLVLLIILKLHRIREEQAWFSKTEDNL